LAHPEAPSSSQFQNIYNLTTLSQSFLTAWAQGIYLSFLTSDAPFPISSIDPTFAREVGRVAGELSSYTSQCHSAPSDRSETDINREAFSIGNPSRLLFRKLQMQAHALLRDSCYVRFIIQPHYLKLLNLAVFTTINVSSITMHSLFFVVMIWSDVMMMGFYICDGSQETLSTKAPSLPLSSKATPSTSIPLKPVSAKRHFTVWNLFSGASKQGVSELKDHIATSASSPSSSTIQTPHVSTTSGPKPLRTPWRESLLTYLQTNHSRDLPDEWWDLFNAAALPFNDVDDDDDDDDNDDNDDTDPPHAKGGGEGMAKDDEYGRKETSDCFSIHIEQLVKKQVQAEASYPSTSSLRDYHQSSIAHYSSSTKYVDNLPQYVRKILLHKARTLTASYISCQPLSFVLDSALSDIGILILSSYVRSKLNKMMIGSNKRTSTNIGHTRILSNKSVLFTDTTSSISSSIHQHPYTTQSSKAAITVEPSAVIDNKSSALNAIATASEDAKVSSRSTASVNLSNSSKRDSRAIVAAYHGSSIFGSEWVRHGAALFVCMGIPRIHLYDSSPSHVHRVSINLHKVTKISPSTAHLYCIELFDDASTNEANSHWNLSVEGVDIDDRSIMTQRWIITIASVVLPYTEVVYILKSGYLKKRGEVNKAFKQRWFVLCSDFRLLYYKDHINGELRGVIDVSYADDANEPVKRKDKEIMIQMSSLKRTWVLMCDDEDGAKSWVAVLNDLLVSIPPAARYSTIVQTEENEYDDDE